MQIKQGSTDITRYIVLKDSTTGAAKTGYTITNLDLQYTRSRSAPAAKVDATALAATNSIHSDNKAIEVDGTSSPGLYRVDWPDAAFASDSQDGMTVQLVVSGSGIHPAIEEIDLVTTLADDIIDGSGQVTINMSQSVPDPGTADTIGEALRSAIDLAGSDLTSLTTGFSASNPNNLNSYLKAMMSKAATVPSGVGTYSPATDSLEAHREFLDLMAGAGFSTSTDSLQAIRDAIDTLVAPAVTVPATASGSGFISDVIGCVRRAVDEPSTEPKYTDSDILEFVSSAYDVVIADININTDHPILVRADLAVSPDSQTYNLPPHVAQIWRIAKINSTLHIPEWEAWPGSEFSFTGRGFQLEGNTIRFLSNWSQADTLQVLFVPNSETFMHKGTIDELDVGTDVTDTTIKFADGPDNGTRDTRPNCYAGYMVRLISSNTGRVEERIITSYDNITQIATINEAWQETPDDSADVEYEVLPQFSRLIKHIVCLRAAIDILAQEGNQKRMQTQTVAYQVKLSALRRYLSSKNARVPGHANGDTIDNFNRGYWGWDAL